MVILVSSLDEAAQYRPLLQGFLEKMEGLATLLPWVTYYDLNNVNVLIDDSCDTTGLIDWEF